MISVTVLTPTIGTQHLGEAVLSVCNQIVPDYVEVRHIVVADGKRYESSARDIALKAWEGVGSTPKVYAIPDNTGANGWNGHKIYAHYAQLLDTDYVCLLDEDNTFEQDHVASLLPIAEKHGLAWSLRAVYTKAWECIGVDVSESIGRVINTHDGDPYILVDTSCWMLRRDMFHNLQSFLEPWSGDRRFTQRMEDCLTICNLSLDQVCSYRPTMNYRSPEHLHGFFKEICVEKLK